MWRSRSPMSGRYRWLRRAPGRRSAPSSRPWPRPATPGFPSRPSTATFIGYLHIKDVLTLGDDPQTVIDLALVRPLPRVPRSLAAGRCAVADAPQQQPSGAGDRRRRRRRGGDGGDGGPGRGPGRQHARRVVKLAAGPPRRRAPRMARMIERRQSRKCWRAQGAGRQHMRCQKAALRGPPRSAMVQSVSAA